jgi:hypothetical protein
LLLVDRVELQSRQVLSLYETELDDMRNLFLPPDEREKRVIALARSTGVGFVLTDDEKQDGPYWSIARGIISYAVPAWPPGHRLKSCESRGQCGQEWHLPK